MHRTRSNAINKRPFINRQHIILFELIQDGSTQPQHLHALNRLGQLAKLATSSLSDNLEVQVAGD